jgi:hypothetical protein
VAEEGGGLDSVYAIILKFEFGMLGRHIRSLGIRRYVLRHGVCQVVFLKHLGSSLLSDRRFFSYCGLFSRLLLLGRRYKLLAGDVGRNSTS